MEEVTINITEEVEEVTINVFEGGAIDIDDTVTEMSQNAVKSSGIWAALQALWQSVLEAFALLTSDDFGNESDVSGATVTDALNNLQAINQSYEATTFEVIQGGTVTGDVSGVQHDNDGQVLRVNEATAGLTVDFTFTAVQSFNFISMHLRYVGGANHVWDVQLYNYTTADWDTIGETIGTQDELTWFNISVPQFQNYLNAGEVKVRFYHLPNFISSHYILFDYVAVVASVTAASPTASSIIVSDPVTPDFTPAVQGNNLQQVTNKVAGLQLQTGGKVNALGSITGANEIDLSNGTFVTATLTGAVELSFTGLPSAGYVKDFVLLFTNIETIAFPVGTKFAGGVPPTVIASPYRIFCEIDSAGVAEVHSVIDNINIPI